MRLWLDDIREAPEGWIWVKTVNEAIDLISSGEVSEASLDHDLGDGEQEGYRLVLYMAENNLWPSEGISIHSMNPVGVDKMIGVILRYSPYRRVAGTKRFERHGEACVEL